MKIKLAATYVCSYGVNDVNAQHDKNGFSYAQKAMIFWGLSFTSVPLTFAAESASTVSGRKVDGSPSFNVASKENRYKFENQDDGNFFLD